MEYAQSIGNARGVDLAKTEMAAGEITKNIQQLEGAIGSLDNALSKLHERLGPILRESGNTQGGSSVPTAVPATSMGSRIQAITSTVETLYMATASMVTRAEL